ncbi:11677_t:CDS:2, partial [Ambispora gerdemannii]
QPIMTDDTDYPFVGRFSPKGDITLTAYNGTEIKEGKAAPGPTFVYLRINITDPTFDLAVLITIIDINMAINEYRYVESESGTKRPSPFEESLFYLNKYTLSGGFFYKLGFSRKIRKTFAQEYLSYIGLPQTYHKIPYIESGMQSVPMASLNTTNLIVRISPRSFIIEEEQEQRTLTILGTLGTIAAYYSSIAFIYVFLFGVDSMTPWG